MPFIYLGIGLILQVLDRVLKKSKIIILNEMLFYFIHYYQPFLRRKHFLSLLFLTSVLAVISDYLIHKEIDFSKYIIISCVIFSIPYLSILFLSGFDYILFKEDFNFKFIRLEMEFIQNCSMLFLMPLFALAYLVRIILLLFIHPFNGILWFHSYAGLLGFVFMIVSVLLYF